MTISMSKRLPRAVADVAEGTIFAAVDIGAPVERVFAALTVPGEIVKWWGSPDTYRTTEWVADLRPGGRWRAAGQSVDGKPFSVEGEFLEVDPPRRLVQTWKPDWDGGHVTTITYRLDPIEGGTRLTMRHEGFAGRAESCEGHSEGWQRVLGWLSAHAAPSQPTQYFLCRLLPPRPTFAQDMNERERAAMLEHVGYWTGLAEKGVAVAFGPVMDPQGAWGLGLLQAADEAQIRELQANDPAIKAEIGLRYDTMPIIQLVLRKGV
jgi:uncharacterized protein YndB with AHSA1/START domain